MMESGNDGSGGLFVWIKSFASAIVGGGDSPECASNYQTLPSPAQTMAAEDEAKKKMDSSDRNNNNNAIEVLKNGGSSLHIANGKIPNGNAKMANGGGKVQSFEESGSSNEEDQQQSQSKHIPEATSKSPSEKKDVDDDVPSLPCCDIMKRKHQLCGTDGRGGSLRRTSPPTKTEGGLKRNNSYPNPPTTNKIPSSKMIEAIIEVIKKGELIRQFDPLVETKTANFHISPLVTACIRNYTFSGLSNIEKAENEGIIRYVGPNSYSIDCVLLLHDLTFDAHYCIKIGSRWHRRPCLRNKSLTVRLEQATVYVELKINTSKRTVRFERFSPISQRRVRCKTAPFALDSANVLFGKMLQRYAEKFLAANVVSVERQARRCLDRSALLTYESIVTRTALNTLFECFPRPISNGV